MTDRYTKIVLTVIAVALCAIALKPSGNSAALADVAGMKQHDLYSDPEFQGAFEQLLRDTDWESFIGQNDSLQTAVKNTVSRNCTLIIKPDYVSPLITCI